MKHLDLADIARQMKAAQDGIRQIEPFTSSVSGFDIASGYEVAYLVHQARLAEGAVPAGREIGFTNPAVWPTFGLREPTWGYIYDRTTTLVSGTHVVCNISCFSQPRIEPEIVFHFRSAPPVGGSPEAILENIDWVAHGFEIVQSRFPGGKFQAADAVADGVLHGALLVGEPQALDRLGTNPIEALQRFSIALSCDGKVREVGKGSNVLGSPLAAIEQLIGVIGRQPPHGPLQAGEIVTTGTLTTACPVQAGETWRTELEGIDLPGLSVKFVA